MDPTSTPAGPPPGAPHAPPGPPGPGATGLQSFFDSLRRSGLVRPDESARSGAGVCAAVAHRLGVDPTLVRVGVVLLTVFGGIGLLAYGLAWLLLPQADGRIHAEEVLHGRFTAGGIGSMLAVFFGFGGFGRWWWSPGGENWGAAIGLVSVVGVALLIGWALTRQDGAGPAATVAGPLAAPTTGVPLDKGLGRVDLGKAGPAVPPPPPVPVTPPPPRRRPAGPAVVALVAGLSLLVAAAILLVDRVEPLGVHVPLVASIAALALVGLAVVVVGLVGRRAGGLTGLAVLALVLVLGGWGDARADGVLSHWRSSDESASFDDAEWRPEGPITEDRSYSIDFGSGTLDLSDVEPLEAGNEPATLTADVRFGSLQVLVPDDLTVEVDLSTTEGRVAAPGAGDGGNRDIRTTIGPDGPVDVRIEGTARLGELVVEEVSR